MECNAWRLCIQTDCLKNANCKRNACRGPESLHFQETDRKVCKFIEKCNESIHFTKAVVRNAVETQTSVTVFRAKNETGPYCFNVFLRMSVVNLNKLNFGYQRFFFWRSFLKRGGSYYNRGHSIFRSVRYMSCVWCEGHQTGQLSIVIQDTIFIKHLVHFYII